MTQVLGDVIETLKLLMGNKPYTNKPHIEIHKKSDQVEDKSSPVYKIRQEYGDYHVYLFDPLPISDIKQSDYYILLDGGRHEKLIGV